MSHIRTTTQTAFPTFKSHHQPATMTELSFAKSFLSTLDSRTIKLQSDHAADPKTFEPKGPVSLPNPLLLLPPPFPTTSNIIK